MKLSPLPQLPASKLKNKKRKKTPAERNADALYAEHLLYKNHLRDQPGIPYVPMGAYGEDQLETLKHMHVKNILYVDVKPENFMLNTNKEDRVYCVDFGISDRYVTATGKHKEYKTGGTVVGTPTFLSLNCHDGASAYLPSVVLHGNRASHLLIVVCAAAASRRDDIESLLYVLIYLMRGDLPWQKASSDAEGAKIKKTTPIEQLCASLPREWSAMVQNIRACAFEDRPDYDFFAREFSKLGGETGLTVPFAWGIRKTSNSTAKVAATHDSPTASPVRKRAKSDDEETESRERIAAKAKPRTAPKGKKKAAPHQVSKPKVEVKKVDTPKEDQEVDSVEDSATPDPRRRRKAAQRAIAGAAAASAAARQAESTGPSRYNLRSSQQD
ncbi:hypothetical protein BBJ28_00021029 [Nothophytophthora sp. Chile5]|nr:hypothetical protein BBJ28_00021029 [Nothophytophthora sp. Chile5]